MRIAVHSDLHYEFWRERSPPVFPRAIDAVVLAGDIDVGPRAIRRLESIAAATGVPVIFVPGNHEYYHQDRGDFDAALLEYTAANPLVHVLLDDEILIGDVRFLGTPLWTDFALRAAEDPDSIAQAMEAVRGLVPDFRLIRDGERGWFTPERARELFAASVAWLDAALTRERGERARVVITHFGPHPCVQAFSRHPVWAGTPYWSSDLSEIVRRHAGAARLPWTWIYGHTHECLDRTVDGIRFVSNQRGYPDEGANGWEPELVIEVEP